MLHPGFEALTREKKESAVIVSYSYIVVWIMSRDNGETTQKGLPEDIFITLGPRDEREEKGCLCNVPLTYSYIIWHIPSEYNLAEACL